MRAPHEYWIVIEVMPIEDSHFARSLGYKDRKVLDEDGENTRSHGAKTSTATRWSIWKLTSFHLSAPAKKALRDAIRSWGWGDEGTGTSGARGKLADVELLYSYGTRAPLDVTEHGYGEKLLKEVQRQAEFEGGTLFGFQMDKMRNGFGATGWDLMKGNPFGKHKKEMKR